MGAVDIGIDLGTANIIISTPRKGIVLTEPSVVAYNKKADTIVAVGKEAFDMLGRTPEYIIAIKPLRDGVISDHEMTQAMIKEFITKISGKQIVGPRIVLCIPSFITDVESRAVVEAALNAGARKVYLIHEPIAAMLGAGVDIIQPTGNMVVDIGGGTTDIAVVSMGGIVRCNSIKIAGNKFDSAIVKYVTNKYKVLVGDRSAEEVKIKLANVYDPDPEKKIIVKGRNLLRGLPEKIEISQVDVAEALSGYIENIIDAIKNVLEVTPPELIGDIYSNGILLTGGGALLFGLAQVISERIQVNCTVAENPLECVAKGTSKAFAITDKLLEGFEQISLYKYK